ncbi:JM110 [macacine gammaherpesvirus 11]|uniref:JM110 n=2 Tax=macacine gammaherpesvirus 11 TaxID=2560570 RepID=G9JMB8_9GAMA|nr:JM110 [Macaca fuscata rhadinovirus]AAT00087.1 JM110 [Macaca fuscata rhadinovirus]AEW87635.1 JM110 [Macaca fuscata rhadinovirus]AEW87805.1 JM110 [Macaca fuscata rhadinovirus]
MRLSVDLFHGIRIMVLSSSSHTTPGYRRDSTASMNQAFKSMFCSAISRVHHLYRAGQLKYRAHRTTSLRDQKNLDLKEAYLYTPTGQLSNK